jgi:hypothetical protein
MSEQKVRNISGVGRAITKELMSIERSTPSIVNHHARISTLENEVTQNITDISQLAIDTTQNTADIAQNTLDIVSSYQVNRFFAAQDATTITVPGVNNTWYPWLSMTETFTAGIVCANFSGTIRDASGVYYTRLAARLKVDGVVVGYSFGEYTAVYAGAGMVNASINWQDSLTAGSHTISAEVMNWGAGGSASRVLSNTSATGYVSPSTIMTW